MNIVAFIREQCLMYLALLIFIAGCGNLPGSGASSPSVNLATPTPTSLAFSREQAIERARQEAGQSAPAYSPLETRIDSATVTHPVTVVRPPTATDGFAKKATSVLPPTAQAVVLAGLTVEENPITARGVITPDRMEYNKLIPTNVRERRMRWRNPPPDARVISTNQVLSKFGYRLEPNPVASSYEYRLFKGDRLVLSDIGSVRPVDVNARGDDFVMWVITGQADEKLIRRNEIQDWKPGPYAGWYAPPVFWGNELLTAHWESKPNSAEGQVVVQREGRTIFAVPAQFYVDDPLKGLWAWNGHWVLEVAGKLAIDGEDQNEALGYDEIFEWHLIHGQPFYFFKKDGRIGISYAGQILPNRYEEVIHYRCCEPAMFNPGYTENMIWFHALRAGMWYYVEVGVYE